MVQLLLTLRNVDSAEERLTMIIMKTLILVLMSQMYKRAKLHVLKMKLV